ncbi:MAG TPA: NFACT family protein [Nitrospira sp.]|nr:NFACT family protein [Nitrospira sp.]
MILNRTELELVLAEVAPVLPGGWIQKIHQPQPRTIVLDIRVPGETHRLLISCEPNSARLHLTTGSHPNPPTPPPFCQFLRAHFQGARLDKICQIENDRIVELQITSKDGPRKIICELTGPKANILILDAERRLLRDCTRQCTEIGKTYAPPPQGNSLPKPALSRFPGSAGGKYPVSEGIDAYYREQESVQTVDRVKDERRRALKKTLKKEQRLIEAWRGDLAKAAGYHDYARYGELIKANLGTITKGTDQIEVTDYFDDQLPTITIPLDPMKSAQGNMDDYFRKHRKYLAAEQELRPRIERAEIDLERLRQELQEIEQGTWAPTIAPPTKLNRATSIKPRTLDQPRGPFRRFISADGLPIFVGRNARENDDLTFGLAKSDDLWLHARGTPGSHVVVRLGKGADPPPETLRDAATLALLYSDLKKSGKGDVIYTRRKWVKKAKGQAPGAVIVTQEKSVHVSLDKNRLNVIKQRTSHE